MRQTIVVVMLAAAACGGGETQPAAPVGSGSAGSASGSAGSGSAERPHPERGGVVMTRKVIPLDAPAVELPKQIVFALTSPGTGARTKLRYALEAGSIDYAVETRLKSRRLEDGAWTPVVEQPPLRDGFEITRGDKPGLLAVRALPAEIVGTKTPEAEGYAAAWTKLLANRHLSVQLDDRGELGALDLVDDPNHTQGPAARDEAIQRLLGIVVPLPDEPVGIGASWQVKTALRQGLAVVQQTGTYKLTARTATEWKIHVVLRRDAEEQIVDDPAMPPGTVADLVAIFRILEGDVTVTPARPVGVGALSVESRVHAKITPPQQAQVQQMLEDTGSITLSAAPTSANQRTR